MIIIKIKTWKDYKNQFLEWVKEPRQNTCIGYIQFMEGVVSSKNYDNIEVFVKKHSLTIEQQEELESLINEGLQSSFDQTVALIKDCQPKHLL